MNGVAQNPTDRFASRRDVIALVLLLGTFALMAAGLWRHYSFRTAAFDLRLHEEVIRNTLHGRFLWSDLLGHSFLAQHASFIFVLLAPIYAICPRPEWLIVIQSLAIGAGGFWLWRFATGCGLRAVVSLVLAVVFFVCHGVVHAHFAGGFHQEVFAMAFLIGFFAMHQSGRRASAILLAALAVSCREDVAVMLFVFGLQIALHRDGRKFGAGISIASLVWLIFAYGWIIPAHAPHAAMAEQGRWAAYGDTKWEILAGMFMHPLRVLGTLVNRKIAGLFAPLLFLPLFSPAALLPAAIPFFANATSSFAAQASFEGAYAAVFVPWFFRAACLTLAKPAAKKIFSRPAALAVFCVAILALNIHRWVLRPEAGGLTEAHSALAALRANAQNESVLAQGCILPHVGWPARSDMLGGATALRTDQYGCVVIAPDLTPWPLTHAELERFAEIMRRSSAWRSNRAGCLEIFTPKHPKRED